MSLRMPLVKAVVVGASAALVCAALTAWILHGRGVSPDVPLTVQQRDGQAYYNAYCASCHEQNELQLKRAPPNLHGVLQRGVLPSGAPASDAAVRHVVLHGRNAMPAFDGRLVDEQVDDIIAYLHSIKR